MNAEFFAAIEDIEKEKGIPRAYMYDKIRQAMLAAFRRDHPENEDNVEIVLDEDKKRIDMQVNKLVVEEVTDPTHEIDQDAAKKYSKRAKPGDTVAIPVETKKFGRIAAQAAKQVIIQGIREAERGLVYEEFTSKEHEILTGIVSHVDPRNGSVGIRISSNSEYTEALLPANERVRGEELVEGDRIKVYVVEVKLYRPVDGSKHYTGTLSGYEAGAVSLTVGEKSLRFPKEQVAQVRLYVGIG